MISWLKRNKDVIKTNPKDRPSVRYAEVLKPTLEPLGYKFLKSKNEFVQEFEFGRRILSISYNNSFGYIASVDYSFRIVFTELEKLFKKVYPSYGWTNWTVLLDLECSKSWLCDDRSGNYSDKTINQVAKEFKSDTLPQIEEASIRFADYHSLHQEYNSQPSAHTDILPSNRLEKRIVNGLILVKNFEPYNYYRFEKDYATLLENYKEYDKEDLKMEVQQGLAYLSQNEMKLKTTVNKT